jgi:AraC-like DNA-binding protein
MLDVFDVFLTGGIFCGFITSVLLFVQARRYQLHANRLLSMIIFPMVWYAFIYLLIKTGAMSDVPGLFKAGSPLYYLIGPCSYLYVRSVIMGENRFRKWDWLHFLPAILHIIDLIPFYLTDAATKKQVILAIGRNFNESYPKGSGLIPAVWHVLFRPVHVLIYLVLQWKLLISALNMKNNYAIQEQVFSRLRTWLFSLTGLLTIITIALLIQTFWGVMLVRSSLSPAAVGWHMQMLMTFSFFAISAYLFFRPDILYGTLKTSAIVPLASKHPVLLPGHPALTISPGTAPVAPAENETLPGENPAARRGTLLDNELIKLYSGKIEEHLILHQSFRKQGLSINQLADELSIPVHHLSYVLNYHYKQRFNDFINQHRVDYVRKLFKEEEWRKMKLEILAAEAGFSSRSTFFVAFKKITGLTPADYTRQADL